MEGMTCDVRTVVFSSMPDMRDGLDHTLSSVAMYSLVRPEEGCASVLAHCPVVVL